MKWKQYMLLIILFNISSTNAQQLIAVAEPHIESQWVNGKDSIIKKEYLAMPIFQFVNNKWKLVGKESNISTTQKMYYMHPNQLISNVNTLQIPNWLANANDEKKYLYQIPKNDLPKWHIEEQFDDFNHNSRCHVMFNTKANTCKYSNSKYFSTYNDTFNFSKCNGVAYDNATKSQLKTALALTYQFYKREYTRNNYDMSNFPISTENMFSTIYSISKINTNSYVVVADVKGINLLAVKRNINPKDFSNKENLSLIEQMQNQLEGQGVVFVINTKTKMITMHGFLQRLLAYGDFNTDGKTEFLFRHYTEGDGMGLKYSLLFNEGRDYLEY